VAIRFQRRIAGTVRSAAMNTALWGAHGSFILVRFYVPSLQDGPGVTQGAADVRICGARLVLRALRPAEIDEEWQAMVTADPMAIAQLPGEASFAVFGRVGWVHAGSVTELGREWMMYRITRRQWETRCG
jgi:hypothetical protein